MPSLADLGMTVSPSEDPMTYPGKPVPKDSILVKDWLHYLLPREGVPVEEWAIALDGGDTVEIQANHTTLASFLASRGAPPMGSRRPVLAIGSNASPSQLSHKFGRQLEPIPITSARVTGIEIAHSAHLSVAGYIPYAPVANPTSVLDLFLLWLDEEQVRMLNQTEPNYEIRHVAAPEFTATLKNGESVSEFYLYRGKRGVLRMGHTDSPFLAGKQETVFAAMAAMDHGTSRSSRVRISKISETLLGDFKNRRTMEEKLRETWRHMADGLD